MTLHTTYFAALDHDLVTPNEDDLVVSVVRRPAGWTEDLVERNIQSLGPPENLLDAVKNVEAAAEDDEDIDDPRRVAWSSTDFAVRYQNHLLSSRRHSVVSQLRQDLRDHDGVWLVCYEKDPTHCHRRLLADELLRGRDTEPIHHPEPDTSDDDPTQYTSLSDYQGGESVAE